LPETTSNSRVVAEEDRQAPFNPSHRKRPDAFAADCVPQTSRIAIAAGRQEPPVGTERHVGLSVAGFQRQRSPGFLVGDNGPSIVLDVGDHVGLRAEGKVDDPLPFAEFAERLQIAGAANFDRLLPAHKRRQPPVGTPGNLEHILLDFGDLPHPVEVFGREPGVMILIRQPNAGQRNHQQ
jgi:hypothetical protein